MPASARVLHQPIAAARQRGEVVRVGSVLRIKRFDRFKHFYTSISRWAAGVAAFALLRCMRSSGLQAGPAAGSALHACRAEFARLLFRIPLTHPTSSRWPTPGWPPAWPSLSSSRRPAHAP